MQPVGRYGTDQRRQVFSVTQVVDEARHTEVLSRYIAEKCEGRVYPMSKNLKILFDYLLGQGKWFIKTVGLQLVAETFAVGLFRMLAETAQDPLLQNISRRILLDESRHMGFSVLGLPDTLASLNPAEMSEVEDFTAEACRLVLRGQFPREAFEKVGLSPGDIKEIERYACRECEDQRRLCVLPFGLSPRNVHAGRLQYEEGRPYDPTHDGELAQARNRPEYRWARGESGTVGIRRECHGYDRTVERAIIVTSMPHVLKPQSVPSVTITAEPNCSTRRPDSFPSAASMRPRCAISPKRSGCSPARSTTTSIPRRRCCSRFMSKARTYRARSRFCRRSEKRTVGASGGGMRGASAGASRISRLTRR